MRDEHDRTMYDNVCIIQQGAKGSRDGRWGGYVFFVARRAASLDSISKKTAPSPATLTPTSLQPVNLSTMRPP